MNRKYATLVLVLVAANLAVLPLLSGPVAAANTPTQTAPGYYNGSAGTVDSGGWLSGLTDASLEDILTLTVRVGPWVIGTGVAAQGGVGSAGVLLTGGLLGAIVMSTGIRSSVGPVGGVVYAVVTTFAFVSVGVGPGWLYAIVLFAVGLVATVALIRALR